MAHQAGNELGAWIAWGPSLSCVPPVPPLTVVDVRFIDGDVHEDRGQAGSFYWKHDGDCDIIEYRVVSTALKPESTRQ